MPRGKNVTVIVTDSGSDLTQDEAHRLGIELVPVWIIFGEERFRDGIDIDRATFFARMAKGENPRTEPATPEQFRETFAKIVGAGNEAVLITLASQISKSFDIASEVAKEFGGKVAVVNSRGASGLETLLAMYALELAKTGCIGRRGSQEDRSARDEACGVLCSSGREHARAQREVRPRRWQRWDRCSTSVSC